MKTTCDTFAGTEIVAYSMGIASCYIAVRLAQMGRSPICLWSDTKREDKDTYRFGWEVAERFNLNIVEASDGRDLWDVWKEQHLIPSRQNAQCSIAMKIEPPKTWLNEWEKNNSGELARVAYGYDFGCAKETDRANKLKAKWERTQIQAWFPLQVWEVPKEACFGFFHDLGIAVPRMYRHFQHANCLPCKNFREKDWRALQFHYPEKFFEALEFENEMQLLETPVRWMQDGPLLIELVTPVEPSRKGRRKLKAAQPAFDFSVECSVCGSD